jgi:hypothetical protein
MIKWDLTKVTAGEYKRLITNKLTDDEDAELIGRACGMTVEEMNALSIVEYRKLFRDFYLKVREPVDPN